MLSRFRRPLRRAAQGGVPSRPLRRRPFRTLALLLATVPLAGCQVTDDQAQQIGREQSAQIDRQLPLVTDAASVAFLDSLGQAIARRADDRGSSWRFQLVNSDEVNAFALPGGFIYVNRGLIARASTLSELAGVLGHEIGHVTLRHSADQLEKSQRTGLGVTVLCTLTSLCDNELGRAAVSVGGNALLARFSRTDELEADSVSVEYTRRAGVDPEGIPRMFGRLMKERGREPAAVAAWFGTHPLEERRIQQAQRIIAEIAPNELEGLVVDDETYQRFRARLAALPPAPAPQRLPGT